MNFNYKIADIILRTTGPAADLGYIEGFGTFLSGADAAPDVVIDTGVRIPDFPADCRLLHTQEFEGIVCTLHTTGDEYFFSMRSDNFGSLSFCCKASDNHFRCDAGFNGGGRPVPIMMRFMVWTVFSMAALRSHSGVAIHSSTVVFESGAVMFLGESGTGKSTHTRLWLSNLPQARLLNDDSPIVRIVEGRAVVFGSPWSGKTPCYKDEQAPLAACVRLSQAPRNDIRRLSKVEAFGALFPSCPPAFAQDERLTDCICSVLSSIISSVPVYHLQCLPDNDAALLAKKTIFG